MAPTRPKAKAGPAWLILALLAGGLTWILARWLGTGPLRAEAPALGAMAALFAYGARYIRLQPPRDLRRRRQALFDRRQKSWVLAGLGVLTLAAGIHGFLQAAQGYPLLEPDTVIHGEVELGFYTAEGVPIHAALYEMEGSEGERFMAPLDTYQGRLLVITRDRPPARRVRVTGRLRGDFKGVQRPTEGFTEQGPFLPLYREHVQLPPDTPVWFLDTSVRAGLNAQTIALFLAPLYVLLLLMGAPTRPRM